MNPSSARPILLRTALAALLAALLAAGCAHDDVERLRAEAARAAEDRAREVDRLEQAVAAERERAAEIAADADRLRAQAAELGSALSAAERAAAEAQERAAEASTNSEQELELVAAHRDELKAWVEELLPVAEANDPRLANLRDAAAEMMQSVESLRGLPFKRPFMRRLIRREQMGDWMRRDMERELPREEAEKIALVGAEFGLLEPGTDLYQVFEDMLEAGALAFYRPDTETFYLIEGTDGRGARPVVFHELVHALEDQYFALDDLYRAVEDDSDRALAMRGLVEGSASAFQKLYEERNPADRDALMADSLALAANQMQMMSTVPPFLVASFGLYPYANARDWVTAIGADSAAELETLYRDPPVSTEQVLHPEKFPLDGPRDYPHLVVAPDLGPVLGDGFEEVDTDSMGELSTGVLLSQLRWKGYMPTLMSLLDLQREGALGFKGAAKSAAEGWDGDRYAAWRDVGSGQVVIVWTSVWDSDQDALEFAATYAGLLGERVTGVSGGTPELPARFDGRDGRVSGVSVVGGRRVVAVLGAPAAKFDALAAAGAAAEVTADPRDAADSAR